MRFARYLLPGEEDKWLDLEVSLGTQENWITNEAQQLGSLLHTFEAEEREIFKQLTSTNESGLTTFTVHNRETAHAVMLRMFIKRVGVNIIKEARPSLGDSDASIYLGLAHDLFINNQYPTDIYIHHIYRKRGTPKTWLTLNEETVVSEVAGVLTAKIKNVVKYINTNMESKRKLRTYGLVDGQLIFVLTKYTGPKVAVSLDKNVEVPSASHTFIVFNQNAKQIGVVSGSYKEVGHVHYYLRFRLFENQLAPRRNEEMFDSTSIVGRLVNQPVPEDDLVLKTLEVKNANLPGSPSLRLASSDEEGVYLAARQLEAYWSQASLSDISRLEYYFHQRTVGLYSSSDDWDRVVINVKSYNLTNLIEGQFLERITARLNGLNIKTTKLLLHPYTNRYVLEKFFGQKRVSTDPAMPEFAERLLVDLLRRKLIHKPTNSSRRICFDCYQTSWIDNRCASCGSSDMRIIGEFISLAIAERELMKQVKQSIVGSEGQLISYVKKARSKYTKSLLSVTSHGETGTIFIAYVAAKEDLVFVKTLSGEGFGIVVILDPRMDGAQNDLELVGVDVVGLVDVLEVILDSSLSGGSLLHDKISSQKLKVLERVARLARNSMESINNWSATTYSPVALEIDIRNLMQALVPDVVRLGTEYSGSKVPDGYLRYGLTAYTRSRKGRLFGWDAKYSIARDYRLGEADLKKQKGYIDWLTRSGSQASQFGALGIYAIISNFTERDQFDTVLTKLASYDKLPRNARIVVIEDKLLALIVNWHLHNWEQVLVNNSQISKVVFSFFRRKQVKPYTVSSADDWPKLEAKLNRILS